MKVVIRAGGVGSRLWPKSRKTKPKQFQKLLGDKTMLQQAFDRARKLVEPEDIFVSTNIAFADQVREQLPELVDENLILEPERRDSAAAIGLESIILASRDPKESVVGLPSDHFIGSDEDFCEVIHHGQTLLEKYPDRIVCVGIRPSFPSTAFGYIQMGDEVEKFGEQRVFSVSSFKEKPDLETAKEFYEDWRYLWNANYFMWRVDHIVDLYRQHAADDFAKLEQLQSYIGKPEYDEKLAEIYPTLKRQAVEPVIMEHDSNMLVLPAEIEWNDVGDWQLVQRVSLKHIDANHIGHDNSNVVIQAPKDKLVATIGLKDMAVIDTEDALLVIPLERAAEVKKIVEQMEEDKKHNKHL